MGKRKTPNPAAPYGGTPAAPYASSPNGPEPSLYSAPSPTKPQPKGAPAVTSTTRHAVKHPPIPKTVHKHGPPPKMKKV